MLRTYSLQERSAITNTSDMYTFTDISLYVVKKQANDSCIDYILMYEYRVKREGTCNEMTAPSTTSNRDLDCKCNISFISVHLAHRDHVIKIPSLDYVISL